MTTKLSTIHKSLESSLYQISDSDLLNTYLFTCAESRQICNDPFFVGVKYTRALTKACQKLFSCYPKIDFQETETCVLHILRGGLNFGIRDALYDAFGWYRHSSAFVSAQRKQNSDDKWYISESDYSKLDIPLKPTFIFGDVVATGTSLKFGLERLLNFCKEHKREVQKIIFCTIGSDQSEKIVQSFLPEFQKISKTFKGADVVYFEGRFGVPTADSPLTIKFPGTDLLRSGYIITPEFFESQYEDPSYPIERCTIYDAGSRAFSIKEYLEDVDHYWESILSLAKNGLTYTDLLEERFPEIDQNKFQDLNLQKLALNQLAKSKELLYANDSN